MKWDSASFCSSALQRSSEALASRGLICPWLALSIASSSSSLAMISRLSASMSVMMLSKLLDSGKAAPLALKVLAGLSLHRYWQQPLQSCLAHG